MKTLWLFWVLMLSLRRIMCPIHLLVIGRSYFSAEALGACCVRRELARGPEARQARDLHGGAESCPSLRLISQTFSQRRRDAGGNRADRRLSRVSSPERSAWRSVHADTKPSCSIHLERKVFYCFGCGAKGRTRNNTLPTMPRDVARVKDMILRWGPPQGAPLSLSNIGPPLPIDFSVGGVGSHRAGESRITHSADGASVGELKSSNLK